MRYLLGLLAFGIVGGATVMAPSETGQAQQQAKAPSCIEAIAFVRQQSGAGVDLLSTYEKDELDWAATVEASDGANCPAVPANLAARYRGEAPVNMQHKRMNCHLAIDALLGKYEGRLEEMNQSERSWFGEYLDAIDAGHACPAVPPEIHLLAKGHKLRAVDNIFFDAAEAGDSNAVLEVALFRLQSGNRQEGFDNLAYASQMGNPWADLQIAELYRAGIGVQADPATSQQYTVKAAEAGLPWAMVSAGRNFETGYGTKRDPASAIDWYRRAAERGHLAALPLAAVLLEKGDGVKKNREKAYELLRTAIDAGDTNSMAIYGGMLLKRNDGDVSEEGLAWLEEALRRGHPSTIAWAEDNLARTREYFAGLPERQRAFRESLRAKPYNRCEVKSNFCVEYTSTERLGSKMSCSATDYWNCKSRPSAGAIR